MKDIRVLVTGVGSTAAVSECRCFKEVKERNIYVVGTDIKERVPNLYIDKYQLFNKGPPLTAISISRVCRNGRRGASLCPKTEEVRGENKLPLERRRVASSQKVIQTHCKELGK